MCTSREYVCGDFRVFEQELTRLDGSVEVKLTETVSSEEGDDLFLAYPIECDVPSLTWVRDEDGFMAVPQCEAWATTAADTAFIELSNDWWVAMRYHFDPLIRRYLHFASFARGFFRVFILPVFADEYARIVVVTHFHKLRELTCTMPEDKTDYDTIALLKQCILAPCVGEWPSLPLPLLDPSPSPPPHSAPAAASEDISLFPHQQATVDWMIATERADPGQLGKLERRLPDEYGHCFSFHTEEVPLKHNSQKPWLSNNRNGRRAEICRPRGGMICHPVGAGKTVIAASVIANNSREGKKTLVFVPDHLAGQWMRELLRVIHPSSCPSEDHPSGPAEGAPPSPRDPSLSPLPLLDPYGPAEEAKPCGGGLRVVMYHSDGYRPEDGHADHELEDDMFDEEDLENFDLLQLFESDNPHPHLPHTATPTPTRTPLPHSPPFHPHPHPHDASSPRSCLPKLDRHGRVSLDRSSSSSAVWFSNEVDGADVIVVPYGMLRRFFKREGYKMIRDRALERVVIDEPQDILDPSSKSSGMLFSLLLTFCDPQQQDQPFSRWILTATPMICLDPLLMLAIGFRITPAFAAAIRADFIRKCCVRNPLSECLVPPPIHFHMLPVTLTLEETSSVLYHAMTTQTLQTMVRVCSEGPMSLHQTPPEEESSILKKAARKFGSASDWYTSRKTATLRAIAALRRELSEIEKTIEASENLSNLVEDGDIGYPEGDTDDDPDLPEWVEEDDRHIIFRRDQLLRSLREKDRFLIFMDHVMLTLEGDASHRPPHPHPHPQPSPPSPLTHHTHTHTPRHSKRHSHKSSQSRTSDSTPPSQHPAPAPSPSDDMDLPLMPLPEAHPEGILASERNRDRDEDGGRSSPRRDKGRTRGGWRGGSSPRVAAAASAAAPSGAGEAVVASSVAGSPCGVTESDVKAAACCICFEGVAQKGAVTVLPCLHWVCRHCSARLVDEQAKIRCPMCRSVSAVRMACTFTVGPKPGHTPSGRHSHGHGQGHGQGSAPSSLGECSTKIGYLCLTIRQLLEQTDDKCIVFAQWQSLLESIRAALTLACGNESVLMLGEGMSIRERITVLDRFCLRHPHPHQHQHHPTHPSSSRTASGTPSPVFRPLPSPTLTHAQSPPASSSSFACGAAAAAASSSSSTSSSFRHRILLLSSEQHASGASLHIANHIFIVHPYCGSEACAVDCVPLERALDFERQAIGRVHRYPQEKETHVYRLYAQRSIEEELYARWNWMRASPPPSRPLSPHHEGHMED